MKNIRKFALLVTLAFGFLFSLQARAVGPDFSTLTAAVDFSSAQTALLTVFAALVGVGVIWAGGSLIVRKVFGGR